MAAIMVPFNTFGCSPRIAKTAARYLPTERPTIRLTLQLGLGATGARVQLAAPIAFFRKLLHPLPVEWLAV